MSFELGRSHAAYCLLRQGSSRQHGYGIQDKARQLPGILGYDGLQSEHPQFPEDLDCGRVVRHGRYVLLVSGEGR